MPEMMAGKRVLVTDASFGSGAATTLMRADAGARMLATGCNADGLGAVTVPLGISTDLIELRPLGQP